MKHVKRIVALILAAVMASCFLTGCLIDPKEKLQGTWKTTIVASDESKEKLLANFDLYEEEIALAEDVPLRYVKLLTFYSSDYRYSFDKSETIAYLRDYFQSMMDAIYEGRTALNNVYDVDFGAMTKSDFQQFYADLYEVADYNALVETFATDMLNMDEDIESGTYYVKSGKVYYKMKGDAEYEYCDYKVKGDTLTLNYSDVVEIYTKK